jgi:uncharacterized membrane protein
MRTLHTLAVAAVSAVAVGLLFPAVPAHAAPTVTHLQRDGYDATVYAINNRGQVAGTLDSRPAVWDAATGQYRFLPLPSGAASGKAFAINDAGTIVGDLVTAGGAQVAARWNVGGSIDRFLPPAGYSAAQAVAVSEDGRMAGWVWSFDDHPRAVRFTAAGEALPITADPVSELSAMSPDGVVAVAVRTPQCGNCPNPILIDDGATQLALPGASIAAGLTTRGDTVIGWSGADPHSVSLWHAHRSATTHKRFYVRTALATPFATAYPMAEAVSSDGSLIAGDGFGAWIHRDGAYTVLDAGGRVTDVNDNGAVLGTSGGQPVVWRV